LTLDNQTILNWLDQMGKESKAIKEDVLSMCWYMRGSVSYDDAFLLSTEERRMINKLIKSNLETTKKTKMPFF